MSRKLLTAYFDDIEQQLLSLPNDPFSHPDAQRRFRVMSNLEELQRALEFPWEKWTVFLHPAQRSLQRSLPLGRVERYR